MLIAVLIWSRAKIHTTRMDVGVGIALDEYGSSVSRSISPESAITLGKKGSPHNA
ncbi:MAG: hypothetical protein J07HR59_01114 [Halorubrum sp. J07HR59]|nr:MAG: hypothetical protein J07HR59_01114 [Halorubrum sp. J07HR59]